MDIKGTKPVLISEAKDILSKRKEESAELGYEQSQALEHCERFTKKDAKASRKIVDAITDGGKVSEDLAVKIVDIWPSAPATIKAILQKEKIELSEEEVSAILKELA